MSISSVVIFIAFSKSSGLMILACINASTISAAHDNVGKASGTRARAALGAKQAFDRGPPIGFVQITATIRFFCTKR
jgi:hypothetical protein